MINFTLELKKELMGQGFPDLKASKSAISAFIHTSGSVFERDEKIGFQLVSETELIIEYVLGVFENSYSLPMRLSGVAYDQFSGRDRFVFDSFTDDTREILLDLGLLNEEDEFRTDVPTDRFDTEEELISFIKGAFLGSGSCTIPSSVSDNKTGYHLEFSFNNEEFAISFTELLLSFDILSKTIERKGSFVVYIQSMDGISDFLHVIGAENALSHFEQITSEREQKNIDTRYNNCLLNNLDRSAGVAIRQCREIQFIDEKIGLNELDRELRDAANMRLAFPSENYQQLADRLGITKSSLSRRMTRLKEIAKKLVEKQ